MSKPLGGKDQKCTLLLELKDTYQGCVLVGVFGGIFKITIQTAAALKTDFIEMPISTWQSKQQGLARRSLWAGSPRVTES